MFNYARIWWSMFCGLCVGDPGIRRRLPDVVRWMVVAHVGPLLTGSGLCNVAMTLMVADFGLLWIVGCVGYMLVFCVR